MRISELSPDHRPSSSDSQPLGLLLEEIEFSIKEAESLSAEDLSSPEKLVTRLRRSLSSLSNSLPLPAPTKLHIWKLSYRLWNACVDLSNAAGVRLDGRRRMDQAELRQIAADLLFLAGNPAGIPSAAFKSASFCHKTGQIWHELGRFDLAASCFERATDLTSTVPIDGIGREEERRLLLDLNLARSRTAWEVADRNLAIALLNRSKSVLFGSPAAFRALAAQYLQFGKLDLVKHSPQGISDDLKLLTEVLDLREKGIAAAKGRGGTLDLEEFKGRCLWFLAAERLQAKDYEGVLQCIRVIRGDAAARASAAKHPSMGFVAMRAWLGAGRLGETESELKRMMANKEVPEGINVTAAEAYLAVKGAEAARGVLAGLVEKCWVGAGAARVHNACGIVQHGFAGKQTDLNGITTYTTSWATHMSLPEDLEHEFAYLRRAMLVCRVVAERVVRGGNRGGDRGERDLPVLGYF